jgi:heat shock protein HslJ
MTVVGTVARALATSVSITGCSTGAPTAGAPGPGLRGRGVLTSGHDRYGPLDLLGQDITLTVTGSTISTGRGSCSNYTATIYGSQRSLWVMTAAPRRFVRATPLSLTQVVDKTWQLKTGGNLSLHGTSTFASETGGYLRFESKTSMSGVTRCVYFTADYTQVADELVASNVLAIDSLGCDRSTDQAAKEFARVFDGGFTFALGSNSLALTSSRARLTLGFNELGAP